MVRILLIANDSLLADGIESLLSQETDLHVSRIKQIKPDQVDQVIRKNHAEIMIIEEGDSDDEIVTVSHLVRRYARSLIITISPQKNQIHICESYQVREAGLPELLNQVKKYRRVL